MSNLEIKTGLEIIRKWGNLQNILIRKKGDIFPHEKFENEEWISLESLQEWINNHKDDMGDTTKELKQLETEIKNEME